MQGSSRGAAIAAKEAFGATLDRGADAAALAEDLFGIVGAIDGSAALRRALGDPSREGAAKAGLVERLFTGKIGTPALDLLKAVVEQRWSEERDLSDTIEELAVGAVMAGAENGGRADQVEDELFRFERVVAGAPALRDALTDRRATTAAKAQVVQTLLEGKTAPETLRLARQAVTAPRGRRFDRVMDTYQAIAETRREQLAAIVTSAIDLDETQRSRLIAALRSHYNKAVHLNVVVDPAVIGGIRVQIGDDVVDGTILRRLEGVRRQLGT
jgi:F-type H+-transporting ATPase subunit delta